MDKIEINKLLSEIYYDANSPASYSGVNTLWGEVKKRYPFIKRKDVQKWVKSQDTYTIHFPFRINFQRSRIVVGGIDYMWEIDLMDMKKYEKHNNGFQYVLVFIDVFSKYVWAIPCKNKSSETVLKAVSKIFDSTQRRPKYIRSDKGREFLNSLVQNFFKRNQIRYILTHSESKAAIVERVIKTIKGHLSKYMYYKQTRKYVDILPKIVFSYNNTFHSTIRRSPISVKKKDEDHLWHEMYASNIKPYVVKGNNKKMLLKSGEYVRISFLRHPFSREYREKWSTEIFQIYKSYMRDGIVVYLIRDLSGEDIIGSFYRNELQEVDIDKDTLYKIEKIIKSKKLRNGKKMFYVKWLNWGEKFNSWVHEEDVEDL